MKNIYSLMTLAGVMAAMPLSADAQNLPSPGFEDEWVECTPWTFVAKEDVAGTQPAGWHVSNTGRGDSSSGIFNVDPMVVADKAPGFESATAVKLTNTRVDYMCGFVAPAYMSLGTPWLGVGLGQGSPSNFDYGTFGGMEISVRPDALEFMYQRSHGEAVKAEKASVIAYAWKGHYRNSNMATGIRVMGYPQVDEGGIMVDRDRHVLGLDMSNSPSHSNSGNSGSMYVDPSTGYQSTLDQDDDAALISRINDQISGDNDEWLRYFKEFEYLSDNAPEYINVIISANDFNANQHRNRALSSGPDNSLTVDNVKLVYYSRLESLQANNIAVELKDNMTDYSLNCKYSGNATDYKWTLAGAGKSAAASLKLDNENRVATITVKGHGEDIDGKSEHVYRLLFEDSSAIDGIEADDNDAPVEMYDMRGVKVDTENPAPGVYVRRQGSKVSKVLVR